MTRTQTIKIAGAVMPPLFALAAVLAAAAVFLGPTVPVWRPGGSPAIEAVRVPGGRCFTVRRAPCARRPRDRRAVDSGSRHRNARGHEVSGLGGPIWALRRAGACAPPTTRPGRAPACRSPGKLSRRQNYVTWYAGVTGDWRLPTDLEWPILPVSIPNPMTRAPRRAPWPNAGSTPTASRRRAAGRRIGRKARAISARTRWGSPISAAMSGNGRTPALPASTSTLRKRHVAARNLRGASSKASTGPICRPCARCHFGAARWAPARPSGLQARARRAVVRWPRCDYLTDRRQIVARPGFAR